MAAMPPAVGFLLGGAFGGFADKIWEGLQQDVGIRKSQPTGTTVPRFGAERLAGVDPLMFLAALTQFGLTEADIQPLMGRRIGEITSALLRTGVIDRVSMDKALEAARSVQAQNPQIVAPPAGDERFPGMPAGLRGGSGERFPGMPAGLRGGPETAAPTSPAMGGGGGGGMAGGAGAVYQTQPTLPAAKPPTPEELEAEIAATYGWAAALQDDPQIARIVDDYSAGKIDAKEALDRYHATDYFKTTNAVGREWRELERRDPAEAAVRFSAGRDQLIARTQELGVELPPERLTYLTHLVLRNGWTDAQVSRFLGAEIRYDPNGQKTGVVKALSDEAYRYAVPMSGQALAAWAQGIVGGTQTGEQFSQYMRDSAVSMFPGMAEALKNPEMDVRKYLAPYAQTIGNTLGMNPNDVDWLDPKWQRFVSQQDPKGNRTVMNLADVQRTLVTDPTYGWDKTAQGQQAKLSVNQQLLEFLGVTG